MRVIHILLLTSILATLSCHKDTFKGSGKYRQTKKSKQSENYLETQAQDVIDKSEKRNKKEEKEKINASNKAKEEEIKQANQSKKDKKKKKNTGNFQFY